MQARVPFLVKDVAYETLVASWSLPVRPGYTLHDEMSRRDTRDVSSKHEVEEIRSAGPRCVGRGLTDLL